MFSELVSRITGADGRELDSLRRLHDNRRWAHADEKAVVFAEAERRRLHEIDGRATMWRKMQAELSWSTTGAEVNPVMLQPHRCIRPGCRVRVGSCEADHLDEFAAGGATRPDDGAPLSRRRNVRKIPGDTNHRDRTGHRRTFRLNGTEIC